MLFKKLLKRPNYFREMLQNFWKHVKHVKQIHLTVFFMLLFEQGIETAT